MLLVYYNPTNSKELWEQFDDSMSEDFKNLGNIELKDICRRVLDHIKDELHSMGHDINEYKLVLENIKASAITKEAKDVQFERNIKVCEEDLLLENKFNIEQRRAYTVIIDRVFQIEQQLSLFMEPEELVIVS